MWRELVVNYVADQNQCALNNIATMTSAYKFIQNNGISMTTLNRRGLEERVPTPLWTPLNPDCTTLQNIFANKM